MKGDWDGRAMGVAGLGRDCHCSSPVVGIALGQAGFRAPSLVCLAIAI